MQEPDYDLLQLKPDDVQRLIEPHQQAIRDLEEKIKWHQKAIAQYRGCLNLTESPINRLMPQEILREIFRQLMWDHASRIIFPSSSPITNDGPKSTWFRVAFVCRYWRSIAISYPKLFTYVNTWVGKGDKAFIPRVLEYTRPNSLHIVTSEITPDDAQVLAPHVYRIKTMVVGILDPYQFDKYPTFDATHFLYFCRSYDVGDHHYNRFLERFPNLERLHITVQPEINITFPSAYLPLLTRLRLDGCTFFREEFIRVMDFLPKLEVLELSPGAVHGEMSSDAYDRLQTGKPLRKLVLWAGSCGSFADVLKTIRPEPEVVQIKIELHSHYLSPSDHPYWMRDVIQARHSGTLHLSFNGRYLKFESFRQSAAAQGSFDIEELRIGNVSPLTAYQRKDLVPRLLDIISSSKVRTILWDIPSNLSIPSDPIADGYDCLENLFITKEDYDQQQLRTIRDVIYRRDRKDRPRLKLLSFEHHGGRGLEDDGRDEIITELKMMVEELKIARGGVF